MHPRMLFYEHSPDQSNRRGACAGRPIHHSQPAQRARCCGTATLPVTIGAFSAGARLLPHLGSIAHAVSHFLSHRGGWGLFLISYLDSSFLAFPSINDILLIEYSSLQPHRAFLYASECTAGSVLGAYTIYLITRKGSRYFSRKTPRREKSHIRIWIERNDFLTILAASLLPPPLPFKIFPIIAGGVRMNTGRLVLALLIGRGIRFSAESWLGIHYGAAAQEYLRDHIVSVSLIAIAVLIGLALIYRWFKRRMMQSA